jgi:hypothetical protein
MDADIIKRYSAPVPRYTSYPTAPHFSAAVSHETYASWLAALPKDERLSLYVHIPFCDTLCWYCACNTKAVRKHAPVAAYLIPLMSEIETVAAKLGAVHDVGHMHWGGGSPNVLTPPDIASLTGVIKQHFRMAPGAEFAVEIDPRHLPPEHRDRWPTTDHRRQLCRWPGDAEAPRRCQAFPLPAHHRQPHGEFALLPAAGVGRRPAVDRRTADRDAGWPRYCAQHRLTFRRSERRG